MSRVTTVREYWKTREMSGNFNKLGKLGNVRKNDEKVRENEGNALFRIVLTIQITDFAWKLSQFTSFKHSAISISVREFYQN